MIGKTIGRIEEEPTDPQYQHRQADTLLIHFTDGTALRVVGSSYEEVSLSYDVVENPRSFARAAQGRREDERLARLKRQEWLAISCDERAARKAARDAKAGTFSLLMDRMTQEMSTDMIVSMNSFAFGDQPERRIRKPCENCGERQCPNAPVTVIPARSAPDGGFTAVFPIFEKGSYDPSEDR